MISDNITGHLAHELIRAARTCGLSIEEEGGIIMKKDDASYYFIKLHNIHAGSTIAQGLYQADAKDIADEIIPFVKDGWKLFASFHTHPSFSATPSSLDIDKLFDGFAVNFIYASGIEQFSISEWLGEDSNQLHCVFMPKETIANLEEF